MHDQPLVDMPSREAVQRDWSRIRLANDEGQAEIVLNDTRHRPRIRPSVDPSDRAAIEFLSASGEVARTIGETDAG